MKGSEMFRPVALAILLVGVAMFGTAATAMAAQRMAVKVDIANIRAKPDTQSDTLWQVEKYYPLLILEEKDGWDRIKDFEGDTGWVHASLLDATPTVIVKVNNANVRTDAGTQYDIAFDANKGTPFRVLEKKGGWLKVQHADGDEGWIFGALVW